MTVRRLKRFIRCCPKKEPWFVRALGVIADAIVEAGAWPATIGLSISLGCGGYNHMTMQTQQYK